VSGLNAHFGISVCGTAFINHTVSECNRKYHKAIKIAERLAMIGCSDEDNLPYFNASDHMASL